MGTRPVVGEEKLNNQEAAALLKIHNDTSTPTPPGAGKVNNEDCEGACGGAPTGGSIPQGKKDKNSEWSPPVTPPPLANSRSEDKNIFKPNDLRYDKRTNKDIKYEAIETNI